MRTVLVVDHSRVARAVVRRALRPFGCRVVEAADGAAGVATARRDRPDLVLLAVTLPVLDGPETLAALRQEPGCAAVPVVLLASHADAERVTGMELPGVVGFVVKPFGPGAFAEAVGSVLGTPRPIARDETWCTVLALPDPRVTARADLRGVLEEHQAAGRDGVLLDLAEATEMNTELVAQVVRALAAARAAGRRAAICAPDARVRADLARMAETRDTPCEATRDALRAHLAAAR